MPRAKIQHDYHLVDPSPWPVIGAVGAFVMFAGAVFWMHGNYDFFGLGLGGNSAVFFGGLALVLYAMAGWWRDIVREAGALGHHKPVVKLSFRYAMILFIIVEAMFFSAWFWAYFNSAIFPTDAAIGSWPPEGFTTFNPWRPALLNTLLLLTSYTTVNWAHHAILKGDKKNAVRGLALTIALGLCFTSVQAYEFANAAFPFGMNGAPGAMYGSTLIMATGLHALHVVIGAIFLTVCMFRAMAGHFTPQCHFGFEVAAWYWYFVIVVWLLLFAGISVWGAGVLASAAAAP